LPPAPPAPEISLAIKAWNLMGGQIDWAALPVIAEMMGAEDIEPLIVRLAAIRDWQAENRE
jgi:hypothetical protein